MESITVNLASLATSVNATLNGPFSWIPDATYFYEAHFNLLAASVVLYLPVIFGIKYIMKDREPFNLKVPLILWNVGLTIFSMAGFYYTFPEFLHSLMTKPLVQVICDPACFALSSSRWIFFFNVSKFFEFGDTIFIVLRKKPLIFLHYYHHVMTCLYCWYANQISCSFNCTGWPFAVMNLFVHSLMYFHYALAAAGIHFNWNVLLTSLQLTQMLVGIFVVSFAASECPNAHEFRYGSAFALIMYFSYAILFANFFFHRYCGKKKPSSRPTTNGSSNGHSAKPKKD